MGAVVTYQAPLPLLPFLQAAEQAELSKLEAEKAKLMAQRGVQSQQLEELKARILAERWVSGLSGGWSTVRLGHSRRLTECVRLLQFLVRAGAAYEHSRGSTLPVASWSSHIDVLIGIIMAPVQRASWAWCAAALCSLN